MLGRRKPPPISNEVYDYAEGETCAKEMMENEIPLLQYCTHDADWLNVFYSDKDLLCFRPICTQLLRLTKVSDKEKLGFQDDVEMALAEKLFFTCERELTSERMIKINMAATALKLLINDSHKGFKMDLLTRVRKTVELNRAQEKKPSVFG